MVSGSYDCTVRIWDIITGACKWVLAGHTQKGRMQLLYCSIQSSTYQSIIFLPVYSVVLDLGRNQACSGSMDGTVRVWNLQTGQCQYALTGHTSLVGLLGLSPSHLVSAAADSTLRIWDPDTGDLRHTLAAHTGAITCFQHDEFKVLSGSDGNLKMWNIRDGTVVRDLLTGITGVWQVVFEGRWCVAASNRNDTTVLDVWDFGNEDDEEWLGEPPGGLYDEDIFSDDGFEDDEDQKTKNLTGMEDEDDEQEQADIDAMDQDLVPSESDSVLEIEFDESGLEIQQQPYGSVNVEISELPDTLRSEGIDASRWAPAANVTNLTATPSRPSQHRSGKAGGGAAAGPSRGIQFGAADLSSSSTSGTMRLPPNDETPTRPRIRNHGSRRR